MRYKEIMASSSLDALFDRACRAEVDGEFALAVKFYEKAAAEHPNSGEVYERMGSAFAEMGDTAKALECFQKAVQVAPEESGTAYMYLGQMLKGEEAKTAYMGGITLFKRDVAAAQASGNAEQLSTLLSQLTTAHCAVAELYLSDLCFSPEAEEMCETHLGEAAKLQPGNISVEQAMASLRISQKRIDEAKVHLQRVVEALSLVEYEEDLPPYEARVVTARLLIDVGAEDIAVNILEHLLKENDEIAETWLLLATIHVRQKRVGDAMECEGRARAVLAHIEAAMPGSEHVVSLRTRLDKIREAAAAVASTSA